jgi:iron(III) transport system permease protein
MMSCLILERPGQWRGIGIVAGLLLALAPALALFLSLGHAAAGSPVPVFTSVFVTALSRSLAVALAAASLSVVIGLPAGVMAGLYQFPLRRTLLALLALPLLVPSFITAIGLSMLRIALGLPSDSFLSGFTGTVLAFATFGTPLVTFITLASVRGISRSQVDAARLAGGEQHLAWCVARSVFPAAALTGILAGVLTLSDPGPGQIFGHSGAASEILVSFASQYDFTLAARQCLTLAGVVFIFSLPVAAFLAPRLATGLLARDVTPSPLARVRLITRIGLMLLVGLLLVTMILPLAGFVPPLFKSFPVERALQEVARTIGNTTFYGVGASLLATTLGLALAVCAGRDAKLRVLLLNGLLLLLALPPSLGALGWIQLAGASPAQFDPMLRSPFTVSLALALRFFPVATIFAMRALGTASPAWTSAAAIHGVSLGTFGRKVLAPWLRPAIVMGALLIVLLATADVTSVLLLHPPGRSSLPLAVFTVMANAPEALVGALCMAYVGGAAALLGVGLLALRSIRRKS